ncbi:glycosyltransferase [Parvularcula mediterranea]|uniref:glycosyltransferase n=1 Tax=Parvularcula mediterranea TaxID=2732508 RepID=UPI0018E9733D|nr:glycosyltransferase family 2 protein [Parvularcula mediterranea]
MTISATEKTAEVNTVQQDASLKPLELSVVLPCFNEVANVDRCVEVLAEAMGSTRYEVIFVDDDSPDGTAARVREIAKRNPQVRIVQRIGRRGLSSAVIEGMMASAAPHIAVMDADLQHDERILPKMLRRAQDGADVVVGSRYIEGGSVGEWDETRSAMSRFATKLSTLILPTEVSDPMSGFFVISRDMMMDSVRNTSGEGFKILLDLLASGPKSVRVEEVPYTFRTREAGESKLDTAVLLGYANLLIEKTIGRFIPARFVMFAAVGGLGLIVHLMVVGLFMATDQRFVVAQSVATIVAIAFNYSLNNVLTFRDKRLKGWGWLRGLVSFYVVCSLGAASNVGIANVVFENDYGWWVAAIAGVMVGAVWNYAVSTVVTWRK